VRHVQLTRQVGQEDDAGLQRSDEEQLPFAVVVVDLLRKLGDALRNLPLREVAVADAKVAG
jgi:hypothetical protein